MKINRILDRTLVSLEDPEYAKKYVHEIHQEVNFGHLNYVFCEFWLKIQLSILSWF